MRALDVDPKIVATAAGLRLDIADPVQSISNYCRKRVAKILKRAAGIQTIWDVERIVCEHLNLVIHEIWNDGELRTLSERYAIEERDPKFAALDMELEADDAYGVLYERNTRNEASELQYVAFVDCRGDKANRRFFTRWHEIAHCLTTFEQFELPFRRVSGEDIEKEPLERLMDMIAGELGFWDLLFRPLLMAEVSDGGLSFTAVESIRSRFCPDASFQATLNACAARLDYPVVIVEVGMAYKKSERELLDQLGNRAPKSMRPKPSLRVLRSMPNSAARKMGLLIHKKRRVPESSVIADLYSAEGTEIFAQGGENLQTWIASDGSSLGNFDVLIQAKRIRDRVFAIITLAADSNRE
jgi:hypothetical protein